MNAPQEFVKIISHIERAMALCDAHEEDHVLSDSAWTLLQHLEHLVITGRSTPKLILDALEGSSTLPLNDSGELLFKLGAIPRGKTQAPAFALPKGTSAKKIKQGFVRLKVSMEDFFPQIEQMRNAEGRSEHPALGGLTPLLWFKFLEIHLAHHLSIIDDELGGR